MSAQINLKPTEPHLDRLLQAREPPKTLCPSEVARALSKDELKQAGVNEWRELMPALREYAFQLRDAGRLEILQKGKVLHHEQRLQDTTGPIRIRKRYDAS